MQKKVIVILPAYNAEKTLAKTVADIPKGIVSEIILVDDASTDNTVKLAEKLGLTVVRHNFNKGYGANQKSCYDLALKNEADIIVMIHPDYQYDSNVIKYLVGFIDEGYCDVMLGTRIRSRKEALDGGMPVYKYISNRILTLIENMLSGQNLSEWHSGMRAYKREVLENIDYKNNSNDFVFDTQVLFQVIEKGYKIGDVPVPVRYFPEASSINFSRSIKYGTETLMVAIKFFLKKLIRLS
ncbi:MAG TPA: glycosyltransferase family 2 protein [Candidatus Paceibacterota bacterium]|nr:glycosyltransferase family 2 protein [Candidatus Paceibacterota bacterium]